MNDTEEKWWKKQRGLLIALVLAVVLFALAIVFTPKRATPAAAVHPRSSQRLNLVRAMIAGERKLR